MKRRLPILAGGSITCKPINQDYWGLKKVKKTGCHVMAVADGLGSSYKSEEASKFICDNFISVVGSVESLNEISFREIFEQVSKNLALKFSDSSSINKSHSYMSTLIGLIETNTEYLVGYAGNGGIIHLRGDFNTFSPAIYLPWNAINMLNPHSIEENGKNAMYRYLSPSASKSQFTPSVIRIEKDNMGPGDILIICSDGIFSNDEVRVGKDNTGKLWISGEPSLKLLYDSLNEFFNNSKLTTKNLKEAIDMYLERLYKNKLLDDDATLTVSISNRALQYQYDRQRMRK